MSDGYFLIEPNDGGVRIYTATRTAMEEIINNKYADREFIDKLQTDLAEHSGDDSRWWRKKLLILKGMIVVPTVVKGLTELRLE